MPEDDLARLAGRTTADYEGFGYAPLLADDLNAVAAVANDIAALGGAVSYLPPGAGGVARTFAAHLNEDARHITAFGVDNTGVSDVTAALGAALSQGGTWYIPAGSYRVARPGPDSGGVVVRITQSLHVIAHPEALIWGDDLDNPLMFITVPSTGIGVPVPSTINVTWHGGKFDAGRMRRSLVVPTPSWPSINEFGAANAGASNGCDLLIFQTHYTPPGGILTNAALRIEVSGVSFRSGVHWQFSGGDSHIFISGAEMMIVDNCRFQGARDLGIYGSHVGVDPVRLTALRVTNCHFVNCYAAIGPKRGSGRVTIIGNRFTNCVQGVGLAGNPEIKGATIIGNHFDGTVYGVRADGTDGLYSAGNYWLKVGAYLADGTTLCLDYGGTRGPYWLQGCTNSTIADEFFPDPEAGFTGAVGVRLLNFTFPSLVVQKSTRNTLRNLRSSGMPVLLEEAGEAEENVFDDCINNGTPVSGQRRHPTPTSHSTIVRPARRDAGCQGFIRNNWYPLWDGPINQGTRIIPAVDRWQLYSFALPMPCLVERIIAHCVTGGAGSSMKFGIWRNGTNGRPIGLPIMSGNTAQSTATSDTDPGWLLSPEIELDPEVLWFGTIFTTSSVLPRMSQIPDDYVKSTFMLGSTSAAGTLGNPTACIFVAGSFATDVATVEFTTSTSWTGATPTTSGCPILAMRAAG